MAYINCEFCGAQMSDKSEACPVCGAPIRKMVCADERLVDSPKAKNPYLKWYLIIGTIVILMVTTIFVVINRIYINKSGNMPSKRIVEDNLFSIKASHISKEDRLMTILQAENNFCCYSLNDITSTPIVVEKDINKDGTMEQIIFMWDQVGYAVKLLSGSYGLQEIIVDGEDISTEETYYMQVSFVDLNQDTCEEIIILTGNEILGINAYVYAKTSIRENPFIEIGTFSSESKVIYDKEHFICPYGSQGLYFEYMYHNGKIKEVI